MSTKSDEPEWNEAPESRSSRHEEPVKNMAAAIGAVVMLLIWAFGIGAFSIAHDHVMTSPAPIPITQPRN